MHIPVSAESVNLNLYLIMSFVCLVLLFPLIFFLCEMTCCLYLLHAFRGCAVVALGLGISAFSPRVIRLSCLYLCLYVMTCSQVLFGACLHWSCNGYSGFGSAG